jgi:hypothetical protein
MANCSYHSVVRIARVGPKRVVFFGDSHCGSNVGLTPPAYQYKYNSIPKTEEHRIRNKWAKLQKECWDWYEAKLAILKPIDVLLNMGDNIDGDGGRSGGTELITTDRKVQVCMAIEAIEMVEAKKMTMVYGTPYHTGQAEDFEVDIAKHFGCKIGSHEWEEINGCTLDLKHKQSNCKNPATGVWNDIVDNREWAGIGVTIPGLQAYGTKFGARACTRKVQFGLLVLDIWPDGGVVEHVHIAKLTNHVTHRN